LQDVERRFGAIEFLDLDIAEQVLPQPHVIGPVKPANAVGDLLAVGRRVGYPCCRSQDPAFIGQPFHQLGGFGQKELIVTVVGVKAGNATVKRLTAFTVEDSWRIRAGGAGEADFGQITRSALIVFDALVNPLGERNLVEQGADCSE
jgi:hypothetical protein